MVVGSFGSRMDIGGIIGRLLVWSERGNNNSGMGQ
jgi:hypothetical protein